MRALGQLRSVIKEQEESQEEEGSIPAEQKKVVEDLLQRMGEYESLVNEIETMVDERALVEREEREERKKEVVAEYGETAWDKQVEEEERGVKSKRGVWGAEQPWVIRFECVIFFPLRHLFFSSLLFFLPTLMFRPICSFNSALSASHSILLTLRQRAATLESTLRTKYRTPSLTLRHVQKIGPAMHVFLKDGVSKIEADPNAAGVMKSGSTRVFVLQVRLALPPFPSLRCELTCVVIGMDGPLPLDHQNAREDP
jgi:hypothetical protein